MFTNAQAVLINQMGNENEKEADDDLEIQREGEPDGDVPHSLLVGFLLQHPPGRQSQAQEPQDQDRVSEPRMDRVHTQRYTKGLRKSGSGGTLLHGPYFHNIYLKKYSSRLFQPR